MAKEQPSAALPTGAKMPLMGFGTLMESLEPDHDETTKIIETAIEVGYRHLDCAQIYNTEADVGRAVKNKIKQGLLAREDVFITTKLWRNAYRHEDVVPSLRRSLEELGLPYVDLFLIHWPTAFQPGENIFPKDDKGEFIYADIDYVDTWKGMEECFDLGLAKAIGVSNFNSKQIQRIIDTGRVTPANNQIETHPFLTNNKIITFCKERCITVTAYAPLAGFNASYREEQGWHTIYEDDSIKSVAAKYSRTPAQVALRYQIQKGVAVAPKSSKKARMVENFQALDFELTEEDMKTIDGCNKDWRLNAEFPDHPHYPFHDEF